MKLSSGPDALSVAASAAGGAAALAIAALGPSATWKCQHLRLFAITSRSNQRAKNDLRLLNFLYILNNTIPQATELSGRLWPHLCQPYLALRKAWQERPRATTITRIPHEPHEPIMVKRDAWMCLDFIRKRTHFCLQSFCMLQAYESSNARSMGCIHLYTVRASTYIRGVFVYTPIDSSLEGRECTYNCVQQVRISTKLNTV